MGGKQAGSSSNRDLIGLRLNWGLVRWFVLDAVVVCFVGMLLSVVFGKKGGICRRGRGSGDVRDVSVGRPLGLVDSGREKMVEREKKIVPYKIKIEGGTLPPPALFYMQ